MYLLLLSFTFLFAYLVLQIKIIQAWSFKKEDTSIPPTNQSPFISVLIPARNEQDNIRACIESIASQDYSKEQFEIILLDDHSEDDTIQLAKQTNVDNLIILPLADAQLNEQNSFKKKAIEYGVSKSKGAIIVTIDADCIVEKDWLTSIANAFEDDDIKAITGPVLFNSSPSLLNAFQRLDMIGMMGVTNACHLYKWADMANGANLAYRKEIFYEVGQFKGSEAIASGDDMFLINKIGTAYPDGIRFSHSKDAVVITQAVTTWKGLLRQRIRWATKSSQFVQVSFWSILIIVAGTQGLLFINLLMIPFIGLNALIGLVCLIIGKGIIDYVLLRRVSNYYHQTFSVIDFIKCLFIHILYFPLIGLLSFFKKTYTWKGRKVS